MTALIFRLILYYKAKNAKKFRHGEEYGSARWGNMSSIVDRDGERKNISNQVRAFAKDFNFKIKLCKPRHPFTKGKVEAVNKFLAWLLPYEGEFETEDELIVILNKINQKVNTYPCQETNMPPLVLFQKEKEYLQPLPSDDVIESYLPHDRQTTVRSDSLVTYHNCKYPYHQST